MFYYEFCEIFKNTYFEEHLRVTACYPTSKITSALSLFTFKSIYLGTIKNN